MVQWTTNIINSMGYAGIVLTMFLENVFPPIPSELIMPLAGFTTTLGKLTLIGVVIAGTLGSVLGSLPLYYLGKTVGEKRLKEWAEKYGAWLAVSPHDIDNAGDWFRRRGEITVFFCRLVPGIRSLISLPAGTSGMALPQFLFYSTLGAAMWSTILAYIGQLLGRNYQKVGQYLGPAAYLILAIIFVGFIVRAVKIKRGQSQSS